MPSQKHLGAFLTIILLLCFVGFVTWLDWVGLFAIAFGNAGLVVGQSMVFIMVIGLLIALGAVLRSAESPRYKRWIVALSIVWLLILPCIPWDSQKALIMDAASLRLGMTKAQVQAIMARHPGVHKGDSGERGLTFCADPDWEGHGCGNGTIVMARMVSNILISVDIDMD
jgi:hypothetical protein